MRVETQKHNAGWIYSAFTPQTVPEVLTLYVEIMWMLTNKLDDILSLGSSSLYLLSLEQTLSQICESRCSLSLEDVTSQHGTGLNALKEEYQG